MTGTVSMREEVAAAVDPAAFARKVLGTEPFPWQAQALQSAHPRQLWLVSRQGSKSTTAAMKVCRTALYQRGSLSLLVSPSQRQSTEVMRKVKGMLSRCVKLAQESETAVTLPNGSRIVSLPGSDATIRGYSANLVILDEAAQINDATFQAVTPMLAVTNGTLIALSTPFGRRGFFANLWFEGGDDWERIRVPATEIPTISTEFLERERRSLGPFLFDQEYMLGWQSATGSVFQEDAIAAIFQPWPGGSQ